jgi:hypothetical protein
MCKAKEKETSGNWTDLSWWKFSFLDTFYDLIAIRKTLKGNPVHVAPAWAWWSDQFGSYVHNLSLHFCKRLFLELETITSWSQGN